jgi:hypothetical protein
MCFHTLHLEVRRRSSAPCLPRLTVAAPRSTPPLRHALLQDEAMDELLPFGEYVSPAQEASQASMLESWELERFLLRLAMAEQRAGERRSARQSRRGGVPSAPQPIRQSPTAAAQLAAAAGGNGAAGPSGDAGGQPSSPGAFPASWPPAAGGELSAGSRRASAEVNGASPSLRGATSALKSRLASLRLR